MIEAFLSPGALTPIFEIYIDGALFPPARVLRIEVTDAQMQAAMAKRAGGRSTVPQIFIGETHVGGCDDLHALDAAGKLDPMLAG